MRSRIFLPLLGFLALVLLLHAPAARAEISVSASLEEQTIEAGDSTRLQIVVSGSQDAQDPQLPEVPHLQFQGEGRQSNFQMYNFKVTYSLTFSYAVTADAAGDYTIPAIKVEVAGKDYSTQPLTLHVSGAAAQSGAANESKTYFGVIEPAKQSVYIGEAIPVQVKYFVDTRISWQPQSPPDFQMNGATAPKLKVSNQGQADRDGHTYDAVFFKTAITPVKPGKLELGPAPFPCIMQLPQRGGRRSNSPFQNFFNDDFPDPFNVVTRQVNVIAPAAELDVKPLPPGQPVDFSGAVGMFKISSQSSASEVKAGEPLTLTISISGQGNFDRVSAPQLGKVDGWRSYPATSKMKEDDDFGLSGTKTFQIALVPSAGQKKLPPLHFSYFDPEQEKYVTLATDETPVTVEGAISTPTPEPIATATQASAGPSPAVAPAPENKDILYILSDAHWSRDAFAPIYRTPIFWVAQGIPLAVLLGFAFLQRARNGTGSEANQRVRRLKKLCEEKRAVWEKPDVSRTQFYDAATIWIRAISAAQHGGEPEALSGEEVLARSSVDENTRTELRSIFDAQAEMLYSGGERSNEPLPATRRETLTHALNTFEKQA